MKLYYSTGSCSLAAHIALCEADIPYELDKYDMRSRTTQDGGDYLAINPNGYVPALQLDNNEGILTEVSAILMYIADQAPEQSLMPKCAGLSLYRTVQWLSFIATEVHKSYSPMFNRAATPEWKAASLEKLKTRYDYVENELKKRPYLLGEKFSIADAYLFVTTTWAVPVNLDLSAWPHLKAYSEKIAQRPAVIKAMTEQGLLK
jgi:glutathione S-transferase